MPNPKQMAWTAAIALAVLLAVEKYKARAATGGAAKPTTRYGA